MLMARAFCAMISLLVFGSIMGWGAAESYTRNKYGVMSPQHVAVLRLFPMKNPFIADDTESDPVATIIAR